MNKIERAHKRVHASVKSDSPLSLLLNGHRENASSVAGYDSATARTRPYTLLAEEVTNVCLSVCLLAR